MSLDHRKLYRNIIGPEALVTERANRDAMRTILGSATGLTIDSQRMHYEQGLWLSRERAFADNDGDSEALHSMLDAMETDRAHLMRVMFSDLTARTSLIWSARWGQNAFPVASISDVQYAASLCTTTMPAEFSGDVRSPWRAFMIRLPPDDLLTIDSPNGTTEHVERILAHEHLDEEGLRVWSYLLEGSTCMVDRTCIPVAKMCVQVDPEEADDRETEAAAAQQRKAGIDQVPAPYRSTARDRRTQHMAARLIVGVCMSFGVDGVTKRVGLTAKSRRRKQPFPTKWEYIVGRPVRVDATSYIRDYIAGKGTKRGPRTIQTLTRGHWKNQPHGPRSTLRKFIHIEPYWSGPEDAPIVVRPHIMST